MKKIFLILMLLPALLHAQENFWSRMAPDHIKLQFAGGIGFLSTGAGYSTSNEKFHADLMYGYVPESLGGVRIHSITTKATWMPVSKDFNALKWKYLTTGININYAIGAQYHTFWPDKYPNGYYNYPTALTSSLFAGGQLHYKKNGFYYEAGITDRQIISLIRNPGSVPFFFGMVNVGFGVFRRI